MLSWAPALLQHAFLSGGGTDQEEREEEQQDDPDQDIRQGIDMIKGLFGN